MIIRPLIPSNKYIKKITNSQIKGKFFFDNPQKKVYT
jgi:hypothetical protein